jgi:CheY-like chemotaxis protein
MASGAHIGRTRILVVEDDVLAREGLAYALKAEGYSVACAPDGRKGLDILRGIPPPNAVVLDLGLPVLDGHEFLRQQSQDPNIAEIPVIVTTGRLSPTIPQAKAVLQKPFDLQMLFGLLAECCSARAQPA